MTLTQAKIAATIAYSMDTLTFAQRMDVAEAFASDWRLRGNRRVDFLASCAKVSEADALNVHFGLPTDPAPMTPVTLIDPETGFPVADCNGYDHVHTDAIGSNAYHQRQREYRVTSPDGTVSYHTDAYYGG